MQMALGRRHRNPKRLGYGLATQSFTVEQDDRRSLLHAQPVHRFPYSVLETASLFTFGQPVTGVLLIRRHLSEIDFAGQRFSPPDMVQAQAVRDREQPGAEAILRRKRLQRTEGPK